MWQTDWQWKFKTHWKGYKTKKVSMTGIPTSKVKNVNDLTNLQSYYYPICNPSSTVCNNQLNNNSGVQLIFIPLRYFVNALVLLTCWHISNTIFQNINLIKIKVQSLKATVLCVILNMLPDHVTLKYFINILWSQLQMSLYYTSCEAGYS